MTFLWINIIAVMSRTIYILNQSKEIETRFLTSRHLDFQDRVKSFFGVFFLDLQLLNAGIGTGVIVVFYPFSSSYV